MGKPTILNSCENCGKDHLTYMENIKKGRGRFCSIRCSVKFRYKDPLFREKMSRSISSGLSGYYNNHPHPLKGRKISEDHKKAISLYQKGRKKSKESIEKSAIKRRGPRPHRRGKNAYNWKGDFYAKRKFRDSIEYVNFRNIVFKRDKWTCQGCGYKGNKLSVHHIELYSEAKEKRIDPENGITLCKTCHRTEHEKLGHSFSHLIDHAWV